MVFLPEGGNLRFFALLPLLFSVTLYATEYGRTKITGTDEGWWVIQSTHFDVYFEEGSESVAESTVVIAEREIQLLGDTFNYLPSNPIPVIVYRSPARFRQTTLSAGDMGEGVGGFTEFYKGRIAVPYTGIWSEYRHVLAHELSHAYVFDMMFRRELTDIIKSRAPLWVMEGLAEYTSLGWDTASEIEFRDMVINNMIASVGELSRRTDYLVYREGQAIYHFMNERYGEQRYLEFVRHMKDKNGIEGAISEAFDMTVDQFSERFIEWARETYWADVSEGESPSDIGTPVMQGEGRRASRLNIAGPVISPDGSKIAGCEYFHARFSGVVRSAVDGEVVFRPVNGGGVFEEAVSPMYRTMAFSPGSDSIAVAFHLVENDGLKISAIDGEPRTVPVEFEMIRDPVWNPEGGQIAFSALQDGSLDIWLYDIGSQQLSRISDNEQGEYDLWWGSKGILCVSEEPSQGTRTLERWNVDGDVEVLHVCNEDISSPVETPEGVVFVSSEQGEPNFFLFQADSLPIVRLTDLYITPRFTSWADSCGIALFQAADWTGSGLFVVSDLDTRRIDEHFSVHECGDRPVPEDIGHYTPENWRISPYQPEFSLDQVSANAGFDSYSGLTGNSLFLFSDVLALHQMGILANFSGQVSDMDLAVDYRNLQHRHQYHGGVYRFVSRYIFEDSQGYRDYVRDINLGGTLGLNYPFTKALHAGLAANYRRVSREGLWSNDVLFRENIFSVRSSLVYDNALWGAVGPRVGSRMSVSFDYAPGFWDNAEYFTAMLDLREYTWISSEVTLATRLAGGISFGENRQRFFLGGALPHRRSTGDVEGVGDVFQFYASYADLLRGWDYVSLNGTRYGVASVEFRFPVLNYLSLAAPIPVTFTRGRGVIFTDLGFVSDDLSTFKGASGADGYRLEDIKMSFGTGFRLNVGFFVLRTDIAWRTDLTGVSQKPKYYFTVSTEF
jgi:hypothetical protein